VKRLEEETGTSISAPGDTARATLSSTGAE
jgi:hypothetical protein